MHDMDVDTLTLEHTARRLIWLCRELRAGNAFSAETLESFATDARLALSRATMPAPAITITARKDI